ncbi:hypothetical protein HK097_004963, partial [Rhizophlyctis rosea]
MASNKSYFKSTPVRDKYEPMDFTKEDLKPGHNTPWLSTIQRAKSAAANLVSNPTSDNDASKSAFHATTTRSKTWGVGGMVGKSPYFPITPAHLPFHTFTRITTITFIPITRTIISIPHVQTCSKTSQPPDEEESNEDVEEEIQTYGHSRKRKKMQEPKVSGWGFGGYQGRSSGGNGEVGSKWLILPYMVSGYIQLLFTLIVIGLLLYMIVQFMRTVQHDLDMKADEYSTEIIHQIAECSQLYITNKCDPETRVQYMEQACKEWELCMRRDPREVGRLKVGAETLAEILNKLVEPLSYKTMAFGTVLLFGTILLSSTAFGMIKGRGVGG